MPMAGSVASRSGAGILSPESFIRTVIVSPARVVVPGQMRDRLADLHVTLLHHAGPGLAAVLGLVIDLDRHSGRGAARNELESGGGHLRPSR